MMGHDYGTLAHTYVMEFQDHDICLHIFMAMFHQVPWRWERGGEGAWERPMQKLPTNFQEAWGDVGVIKIIKFNI